MLRLLRYPLPLGALLAIGCAESASEQPSTTPPAAAAVALVDAPDKSFTRGDVTINYRSIGAGDPILLIHGYGDNLKMWAGLADSLAATHRVIAVDTRGFGKSSKPAGAANYGPKMVEDLVALLDSASAVPAHVVGYSMGAMLAADLALQHPDRVRSVTLAAGTFHKDAEGMRGMTKGWLADLESGRRLTRLVKEIAPAVPDSVAKGVSDQLFAESDSAALVGIMRSFADMIVDWSKVDSSKIPAVAIVGADDPLRPFTRDIAARWPGARHVEIPATDHTTIAGAPQLLAEIRAVTGASARP